MIIKILTVALIVMVVAILTLIIVLAVALLAMYIKNKRQSQHSVLRLYPILGMFRYIIENLGPELRSWWTNSDIEGKPFSRYIFQQVVRLGKYMDNIMGFGSKRDFEKGGFYIANTMFCINENKLEVDNSQEIDTFAYRVSSESLFWRDDERYAVKIKPYNLKDYMIIGDNDALVTSPWFTKSFIGMSAMSYGSLGDHSVQTLANGLFLAGSWINTGEGGVAPYHFMGGGDVVFQFGPAMFGVRDEHGNFSPEKYAEIIKKYPKIVATEIKFHQGAKIKGGILLKKKITQEVSTIRSIPMGVDCISPNVYPHISNAEDLGNFILQIKQLSSKPVGIKIVMGQSDEVEDMLKTLKMMNALPSYIALDGSEGGSGAAPQDMSDSLGLPLFTALPILNSILIDLGLRDRIKIFASGKLVTADQIVIAMSLGADCANIARGLMMQLGCIQAGKCDTNKCPTGTTTHDRKLQDGLVIAEKMYRVANYIVTLRKHVFLIAAACGVRSPRLFTNKHIAYQVADGIAISGKEWVKRQMKYREKIVA